MPDDPWLSAHLFWDGPLDELLHRCVAPLVQYGQRRGWVRQFFFIRYAEGGPHVRLRLRAASAADRARLERLVARRFAAFGRGRGGAGQLQLIPYAPETARYGGPRGLPLAEAFFEASSVAVLRWLRTQAGTPAASTRLAAALRLHAPFAQACWPAEEAAAGLRQFVADWLPRAPAGEPAAARPTEWLGLFAAQYQQQRPALRALLGQPRPPAGWLGAYARASEQLATQLARLKLSPNNYNEVVASLLHMTNNRLGVANHDEAFIAYLLAATLADQPAPSIPNAC